MFLIYLGLLALGVNAGIEYLGFDMKLTWNFPDEDTIEFELYVPSHYREAFGWVGIAIQDARDARDSFTCDYYIGLLSDGLMTDRFARANGFSKTDEDQGGNYDLVVNSTENQGYFVIYFSRKLNTGDPYDIVLIKDKPFMVKYALGPLIEGNIEQHSFRYNGLEYVVLSQDYVDYNDDERKRYGPWSVEKFQDQKWFEAYGMPE